MNRHSRSYLDLNPAPGQWVDDLPPRGATHYAPSWVLVALAVALLFVQLIAAFYPRDTAKASAAQAYESQALTVEEARLEGFRAGYDTAIETGCTAVPLSPPLQ
jgi:hypothetical protein